MWIPIVEEDAMRLRPIFPFSVLTLISFAGGCASLSDQAPPEFHEAQAAIRDAQRHDVDDTMPRAMEAAERRYEHAVELLDDSGSFQRKGETSQADSTRKEAIAEAVAAREIARTSVKIVSDVDTFDRQPGDYLSQQGAASDAARLTGENEALKAQNTQLQAQVDQLNRSNGELTQKSADLANRPAEEQIPADFRVAKPVAFFGSGKTSLNARSREDIEDLTALLKKNPNLAVTLEGFADPRGSAELNQRLATERVQAVASEIERQGIDPKRITQTPVGETSEDVATNNQGALQLDRKVVAKVTVLAH
jgi:outer membrane protein OmpA-like peptidoglycan-associated protein